MGKIEFIEWLLVMFPHGFTPENGNMWMLEYSEALGEKHLDYLKLKKIIIKNWKDNFAPKPAVLLEMSEGCKIDQKTPEQENFVNGITGNGVSTVSAPPETKEMYKKLLNYKFNMNTPFKS